MKPFHYYLATDGLGPGTTHYTISVLGRRVEISVTPLPSPSEGGYAAPSWIPDFQRYEITVKIVYKDRTWTETREVNSIGLASLEKVIAIYKSASALSEKVMIYAFLMKSKLLNLISINIKKKS